MASKDELHRVLWASVGFYTAPGARFCTCGYFGRSAGGRGSDVDANNKFLRA